ncbi:MAG: hypothetical protein PHV02_16285 [Rhodocyclaceae bacterium]|nr:hypothetical protein [Rhodocyclaceae bacterium]
MNTHTHHPNIRSSIPVYGLLPLVFCTACTTGVPLDIRDNETVIASMMTDSNSPWRLDCAWQVGGLGGSALRAASIEHVVRQVDQPWSSVNSSMEVNSVVTAEIPENIATKVASLTQSDDDPSQLERAWRKYCHHQLDLSIEERALIDSTDMPAALQHACNPSSLMK